MKELDSGCTWHKEKNKIIIDKIYDKLKDKIDVRVNNGKNHKQLNQEEYLKIINKFKENNKEDYDNGNIKKVFLDNLSIYRGTTNWIGSIGFIIYFIYNNIEGWITIKEYIRKNNKTKLNIIYDDKSYYITTDSLKKCELGKILGRYTSDFKIEVEQTLQDDKRDITILDRKYIKRKNKYGNEKWYKYKCNKCGWNEGWIRESNLLKSRGCSCCHGNTLVQGINDIPTTAPWMVKYFKNGYDEAKLYTKWGSGNPNNPKGYICPICLECRRIKSKKIAIGDIYARQTIACSCGDGKSYGEKFIMSIFEQLNVEFETEYSPKWIGAKRYDFYITNFNAITEVHGIQHYEERGREEGRHLKEEQENDRLKKQFALSNDIKEENYIVIDCRKSNLEWIKNNILKSNLSKLFDLSKIDWIKAQEFACSNLVKVACEYKKNNSNLTTVDIGILMKLNCLTICRYLKQGNGIWCNYDAKEEKRKGCSKLGKNGKPIEIFKDGISLGYFESACSLERQSEELFGIKLWNSAIIKVCKNQQVSHNGYTFRQISKQEYKERIS